MADGTVGIKQATTADRFVDNEVLTVDGQTVYRQRVVAYTTPGIKVGEGKAFTVGMTQSVAAGANGTFSLTNPADSGIVAYILGVKAYNDSAEQIRFEVWENSTIDAAATTVTPWDPNRNTRSTSALTAQYGSGVRTGGTQLDAVLPATRESPYGFEGLIVLPPGRSLQLVGVVPGAISAQQLTVVGNWYEE